MERELYCVIAGAVCSESFILGRQLNGQVPPCKLPHQAVSLRLCSCQVALEQLRPSASLHVHPDEVSQWTPDQVVEWANGMNSSKQQSWFQPWKGFRAPAFPAATRVRLGALIRDEAIDGAKLLAMSADEEALGSSLDRYVFSGTERELHHWDLRLLAKAAKGSLVRYDVDTVLLKSAQRKLEVAQKRVSDAGAHGRVLHLVQEEVAALEAELTAHREALQAAGRETEEAMKELGHAQVRLSLSCSGISHWFCGRVN